MAPSSSAISLEGHAPAAPTTYDLCIVGAGPGGLSVLSAAQQSYSHDHLTGAQAERAAEAKQAPRKVSVCVVDPEPWLSAWRRRFQALEIEWLRSPCLAHPDLFDRGALLAYALERGRGDELLDSGAAQRPEIKGLPEAHDGMWSLPSSKLFLDFADDLVKQLPHDFLQGTVASITGEDGSYSLHLTDGQTVTAAAVVLASGVPGPPVIPPAFQHLPPEAAFHTDKGFGENLASLKAGERVLVVGGGLTAVQATQLARKRGCRVTLCTRRPLTTRHFDLHINWFDWRSFNGLVFDYWSRPVEERLQRMKEARGGGSVPPFYMEQLRKQAAQGLLEVQQGVEAQVHGFVDGLVQVELAGQARSFHRVVLACGHKPDCLALPLFRQLLEEFPTSIRAGLPALNEDLQWSPEHRQLFVVGALAALQVGPDAANLMGLRRAAHIVAQTLGVRKWLKETGTVKGNITGNRYAALDSDSDDESEEASTDSGGEHSGSPSSSE